ncbi:MAG: ABC transporter permease, partial [Maribacter sp.]|nr:ABC transporter permease [Maribacter sp.]
MLQILVIAKQTFREAVRNKILFIFIILSLITICCSVFMPVVGDGKEKIKIVESMCFRSITFFGTLAAILLSASSIPTDIDNKVLCTVTTKPVKRTNIILGKIIGFIYIVGLLLLIMGSVSYVLIRFTAVEQGDQGSNVLLTREKYDPYSLQITGKPTKKIGNSSWIEGGGKGASVWKFKGLNSKVKQGDLEIRA